MRIGNTSVSVVIRSYGIAERDGDKVVDWLEIAPQHPKSVQAIWASLVNGSKEGLVLRDANDESIWVTGLHRRYHRTTADAPRIAARARPQFVRLVAPEAVAIPRPKADFIALEWPGRTLGQSLAALLEKGSPYPIQLGWGNYLLREAVALGHAVALITGGPAPRGYAVDGNTPWDRIITEGLRKGLITIDGGCKVTEVTPESETDGEPQAIMVSDWPHPSDDDDFVPLSAIPALAAKHSPEDDGEADDPDAMSAAEEHAFLQEAIARDAAGMARSFLAGGHGDVVEVSGSPEFTERVSEILGTSAESRPGSGRIAAMWRRRQGGKL